MNCILIIKCISKLCYNKKKLYRNGIKIVKDADNNNKWKRKAKNKDRKEERGDTTYSETVRAKWFCCTFELGLLQFMCKSSLIFKLNLELALSIILKERENCVRVKRCCGGVWMFRTMKTFILIDMLLNLSFKMTTIFTNVTRTAAHTSKSIY